MLEREQRGIALLLVTGEHSRVEGTWVHDLLITVSTNGSPSQRRRDVPPETGDSTITAQGTRNIPQLAVHATTSAKRPTLYNVKKASILLFVTARLETSFQASSDG